MTAPQPDPMAIFSILLGLLSWGLGCCVGLVFSIGAVVVLPVSLIGMVVGVISLRRIRAEPEFYTGVPIAAVGIAINALHFLVTLLLGAAIGLVLAGIFAIPMLEQL